MNKTQLHVDFIGNILILKNNLHKIKEVLLKKLNYPPLQVVSILNGIQIILESL